MSEAKREPLFHISKRTDISWQKALLIRVIAIALALGASAIICLLLTDDDPLAIYSTIIKGTFGTPRKTWVTFRDVAMLLCISLAVTPAFKMRFWNIGGEGQTLMGCLASASCMILLRDVLPNWALILVMLLTSMLAGAIWGGIPALFKAKWNTNETLFTLMMTSASSGSRRRGRAKSVSSTSARRLAGCRRSLTSSICSTSSWLACWCC